MTILEIYLSIQYILILYIIPPILTLNIDIINLILLKKAILQVTIVYYLFHDIFYSNSF